MLRKSEAARNVVAGVSFSVTTPTGASLTDSAPMATIAHDSRLTMQARTFLLFTLLAVYVGGGQVAGRACNVCQTNGVACVNATSFYLCFGGTVPSRSQMFHCNDGLVCTDQPNICFQNNAATASCGDISSCGLCNANQVFACTSRTTFAFCFGDKRPTDVTGSCPTGRVCDASTQDICVHQPQATSIICNLEKPLPIDAYADFLN